MNILQKQFTFKELKPMEIVLLELLYISKERIDNFSKFDFCVKYNITSRTLEDYLRNLKRLGFIDTLNSSLCVQYSITEDGIMILLRRDEYLSEVEKNKNKGF